MDNTVETNITPAPVDDVPEMAEVVEEQDASESIESVLTEENAPSEQPAAEEAAPASEPGWIKKRVEKAVSKAVAEAERRVAAQYEARFAPFMEKMLENDAKELVRTGEFKSLERAKEYLQLKNGQPVAQPEPAPKPEPNRDSQGRFAPQQQPGEAEARAKAQMLANQAQKLAAKGVDVMSVFNNDPEARQKVVSGEWDFYDLAESLDAKKAQARSAPKLVRSPNGATGSERSSIATMTDAQFERLDKNISEGRRYSV